MAEELKGRVVGWESKVAEVDGIFRRLCEACQSPREPQGSPHALQPPGKRKVVVVVQERGSSSIPAVFKSERDAYGFLRSHVAKGTTVNADEANSWNELHKRFEIRRINHEEAYSLDGACAN